MRLNSPLPSLTPFISSLENAKVDQSIAMTGALSVRGLVLPIGGVTAKIEAAVDAGIKKVIIPKANLKDVFLESEYADKVEVIPVTNLKEVLDNILIESSNKEGLMDNLAKLISDNVSNHRSSPSSS